MRISSYIACILICLTFLPSSGLAKYNLKKEADSLDIARQEEEVKKKSRKLHRLKTPEEKMEDAVRNIDSWSHEASEKAIYYLEIQGKKSIPPLIRKLQDLEEETDKKKILDVIYVFGRIGSESKRAVPTIVAYLDNKDKDYRITSAAALGSIGPVAKSAVHSPSRLLFDERDVSLAAERALEKINSKEARKALEEFKKLNL